MVAMILLLTSVIASWHVGLLADNEGFDIEVTIAARMGAERLEISVDGWTNEERLCVAQGIGDRPHHVFSVSIAGPQGHNAEVIVRARIPSRAADRRCMEEMRGEIERTEYEL